VADPVELSRSTLQRRLHEEKTTYQEVLDGMRRDLAIRYLTKTSLRADEIANVLAFREAFGAGRASRISYFTKRQCATGEIQTRRHKAVMATAMQVPISHIRNVLKYHL